MNYSESYSRLIRFLFRLTARRAVFASQVRQDGDFCIGVRRFSLCLCRFSRGIPVSLHSPHAVRLIQATEMVLYISVFTHPTHIYIHADITNCNYSSVYQPRWQILRSGHFPLGQRRTHCVRDSPAPATHHPTSECDSSPTMETDKKEIASNNNQRPNNTATIIHSESHYYDNF